MLYTISGVPREAFSRFPMPRNTAVFAPTFSGKSIVRSDDITRDPRYGKNEPRRGMPEGHLPVRSYLAVPVVSRSGEVLGGLFFGHGEPGQFTEQHENIGAGIAGQAAIALDNARLFTESMRNQEDLKRANNELRRANSDLEQFAYSASHDLQEPIRNVAIYSQIIQKRYAQALDDKGTQYISFVIEGAQRLGNLVKDLLAYAQSGKAEQDLTEDVDSGIALRNALEDLAAAIQRTRTGLSLTERCPEPRSHGATAAIVSKPDRQRPEYRRDGDSPRKFRWRGTRWSVLEIFGEGQRNWHSRRVSRSDLRHFRSSLHGDNKYAGTGIGLAICQRIVERNGGRIWVGLTDQRNNLLFHIASLEDTMNGDRPRTAGQGGRKLVGSWAVTSRRLLLPSLSTPPKRSTEESRPSGGGSRRG